MSDFLPFIVAGIVSGTLYGLAATGLVLTYKTSGILNFAHGAVAAACAYVFYDLRTVHGVPWPIALALSVFVLAPILGIVLERLGRRLTDIDTTGRIVATVGVLVFVQGFVDHRYGLAPLLFEPFLSSETFRLGGLNVGYDQLGTILISLAVLGALFAFFRSSRLGLQMRAVVDNHELLDLTGTSPTRVRRAAWIVGCIFAALSGILLAAAVGLDLSMLTLLVVQAFGAASIGRFSRLGVTFGAAVGIGVVGEVIKKYVPDIPALAGLPPSLPFLVLFGVLLFAPAGRFREVDKPRPSRPTPKWSLPRRATVAVLVVGLVAWMPSFAGVRLPAYTNAAIYVVLFVSLSLLVRLSGQVSLCQMSFAAVGATTFAHLQSLGLPWLVACVLAGLVAVPLGALLSLPAIRLSSLYLGLATFGFAILLDQLVFRTGLMFGGLSIRSAERPQLLGLDGDHGFFYLCAAVALAALVVSSAVARSRLGRLLRAMADSPVALIAHGANVNISRVIVFCLSAFMAGIAGVLLITLTGSVSASGATFTYFQSLMLLVALAIAPPSLLFAPVAASIAHAVVPTYIQSPEVASWQQMIFGVIAIVIVTSPQLHGLSFARNRTRTEWRARTSPVAARRRPRGELPVPAAGVLVEVQG